MEYGHGGDIYTYKGMLDFSVNINPFGPSEQVIRAVRDSAGLAGNYPDSSCRRLRQKLAEKKALPREFFIAGNGAADLFFSLALAEKPERALIPVPAFSEYARALHTVGCEIREYPLKREDDFRLTEDFINALERDIDMVFLCDPSNPAGQTTDRELIERIAEKCQKYGIRLVVDECFIEFLSDPEEYTVEQLTRQYPCLFVAQAFTKMHAIPGLRLGYGITSDKELLEKIQESRQPWSVSTPAQAAGTAALDEEDRVKMTRDYVRNERMRMEKALGEIGVQYIPSEANFILFSSPLDLFSLLKERGILIRDCSNYSGLGKGWYRIAVKRQEENNRILREIRSIYQEQCVYQKQCVCQKQ